MKAPRHRRELHQRFLIRVRRYEHGFMFEWYRRRRLGPKTWGWGDRPWRAYVSATHDFRLSKCALLAHGGLLMNGYQPELGQMAFGNPWAEHECPAWVDALVRDLLREIGRVYWNKNQREWDLFEDPQIPGVEFRPYYWGNDEGEAAKPNLKHGDVEVRWYKHPMRGSSLNIQAEPWVMVTWFESALAAIQKVDAR